MSFSDVQSVRTFAGVICAALFRAAVSDVGQITGVFSAQSSQLHVLLVAQYFVTLYCAAQLWVCMPFSDCLWMVRQLWPHP